MIALVGRIFNKLECVCACVRVCVKSTLDCASCFLFCWGHYTYSLHLGHIGFSSLSLWWRFCFWVDQQHKPRGFCFPEHGTVAGLFLFLSLCAQLLQTVKEICRLWRSSRVKSVFLRCECVCHISQGSSCCKKPHHVKHWPVWVERTLIKYVLCW